MARALNFTIVLCLVTTIFGVAFSQEVTPAPPCQPDDCILPDCRCSGPDNPGNLTTQEIPQIVFLTFDDAVNSQNYDFYHEMFFDRKNPNGQPITITLFVSHEYTNYSMVHDMWRHGHEIALHSITHSIPSTYWATLNETMWKLELSDQRDQMAHFANIPKDDIRGMRAPFLQIGGDAMYSSLYSGGFSWESSRPSLPLNGAGLWPYTNDYESTQDCEIKPCPVGSYPGFWTAPMHDLTGDNGQGCSMVDSCAPVPETATDTFNLLNSNFQNHYTGHRAPFGIYTHAAWLNQTGNGDEIWQRRLGYIQFLDYLATLDDTYIVGISRGLEWVKNPTPLDSVQDFPAFQTEVKPSQCPVTFSCCFNTDLGEKWLRLCTACPRSYPWLGNPLGNN